MTIKKNVADEIYQHGYHVIDNFLDHQHYLGLRSTIQSMQSTNRFEQAKIGHKHDKVHNSNIRNDQILWLNQQGNNQAIDAYFTKLDKLCDTLNQALFLGLVDYEAHFSIYQPNSFYKKHIDQFSDTTNRRISCVYYLNEGWQQAFGGELKLYEKTDQLLATIMPLGNRFVCFNSDLPHEVCTTYQMRYSIASWLQVRSMLLVS